MEMKNKELRLRRRLSGEETEEDIENNIKERIKIDPFIFNF
jgi:hypothetical protein